MGTLYICPTPIGNLDDVSQRLIDVLNNVDLIYCEDTRRAKKLLNHFGIETGIESYFIGNEVNKIEDIKRHLENNLNLALISCLLYTSPSPRDATLSRMPSSA